MYEHWYDVTDLERSEARLIAQEEQQRDLVLAERENRLQADRIMADKDTIKRTEENIIAMLEEFKSQHDSPENAMDKKRFKNLTNSFIRTLKAGYWCQEMDFRTRQEKLEEGEDALGEREGQLEVAERKCSKRWDKAQDILNREGWLHIQEKDHESDVVDLDERESQINDREKEMLEDLKKRGEEMEKEHEESMKFVDELEAEVYEYETQVEEYEARVEEYEDSVYIREENVTERERKASAKEEELQAREAALPSSGAGLSLELPIREFGSSLGEG